MDSPRLIVRGRLAGAAALRRIGATVQRARPPESGAADATLAGYLYVPCARVRYHGSSAETRRWVQEVPIVRKTARWIYYTSDSWDRAGAVVSPGRIGRREFYRAGVIPIPGARSGSAGQLFFATRQAAERHLYRSERERPGQVARDASRIRELRRAMAAAHPDRGGTAELFIRGPHTPAAGFAARTRGAVPSCRSSR